ERRRDPVLEEIGHLLGDGDDVRHVHVRRLVVRRQVGAAGRAQPLVPLAVAADLHAEARAIGLAGLVHLGDAVVNVSHLSTNVSSYPAALTLSMLTKSASSTCQLIGSPSSFGP